VAQQHVQRGAVAERLDSIQRNAGINAREVADLIRASPATISRWRGGRVQPEQDRLRLLLDLNWLTDQLADFYAPDEARLWLYARHSLLGGARPYDQIRAGHMDDVLALIDQLRSGAVV
jgi:transcriptional regulator with XRE-family HTH domain